MSKIVCLKWKESFVQKFQAFEQLRVEGQFCDITLQGADYACVKAHKIILVTGSDYFKNLFSSGMKEILEKYFIYVIIKGDVLEKVISFMYTGEMDITSEEKIEEIAMCAKQFQLVDLFEECVKVMSKLLNDNNCLNYWRVARKCLRKTFEAQCISHVFNSPNRIYENASFFNELDKDEVEMLINDDRLDWIEDKKLKKLLEWTKQNTKTCEEFKEAFLKFIEFINFTGISKETVLMILTDKYVMEHRNIVKIITGKCEEQLRVSSALPVALSSLISKKRLLYIGNKIKTISNDGEMTILHEKEQNSGPVEEDACTLFNNFLFTCGGRIKWEYSNVCEYFDPRKREWHNLPSMRSTRNGHACTFLEDKIYVCGGWNTNNETGLVEIFDINQEKWTRGPNMPSRNTMFGLTLVNRALYAVGGLSETIEIFDPRSGEGWTEVYKEFEHRGYTECISLGSDIYCILHSLYFPTVFDTKMNKMRVWSYGHNFIQPRHFNPFKVCEFNGEINIVQYNENDKNFIDLYEYDLKQNLVFSKPKASLSNNAIIKALVSLDY